MNVFSTTGAALDFLGGFFPFAGFSSSESESEMGAFGLAAGFFPFAGFSSSESESSEMGALGLTLATFSYIVG